MYTPSPVPAGEALNGYLDRELRLIARAMADTVPQVVLATLNVAPSKPRDGMVVMADGTNWNPGSGAGIYGYRGGAWHFLG